MDRRNAVKHVAVIMGGVLSASTLAVMLDECKRETQYGVDTTFTADEQQMVAEISDIIIPRTGTPGAKDAGVPAFIIMMMQECFPETDQKAFHSGLKSFNDYCNSRYGHNFMDLPADKQIAAVRDMDTKILTPKHQQKEADNKAAPTDPLEFYRQLKELTLIGYFTSKPGATEALRYIAIPGKYEGCIPYHKGDKAWAT